MGDQKILLDRAGRLGDRQAHRAGAVVLRRGGAVGDGRVDDVRERQVGVVELEGEPPAGVALLEPPAESVGSDVLALGVEDPHRVDDDAGDQVAGRVEEGNGAVAAQARLQPGRELPAPRPLALTLDDGQELLGLASVDDDRLGAEVRLARDTVNVAPPLGPADVLGDDRDGRAPVGDGIALVMDSDADAGRRRALHGRLGLLGAERLLEEAWHVRVEAPDAREDDDREEHRCGGRDRGGCPHGRGAAQNGGRLDVSRAGLRGPQGRNQGHRSQACKSVRLLERIVAGRRVVAAKRYENGMRSREAPIRVSLSSPGRRSRPLA